MDATEIIAKTCGELLARGVPTKEVLAVESRLSRMIRRGLPSAVAVELPEYGLRVHFPPTQRAENPRQRWQRG